MSALYKALLAAKAAKTAVEQAQGHDELMAAGSAIEHALDLTNEVYAGDQWHPREVIAEAIFLQLSKRGC